MTDTASERPVNATAAARPVSDAVTRPVSDVGASRPVSDGAGAPVASSSNTVWYVVGAVIIAAFIAGIVFLH